MKIPIFGPIILSARLRKLLCGKLIQRKCLIQLHYRREIFKVTADFMGKTVNRIFGRSDHLFGKFQSRLISSVWENVRYRSEYTLSVMERVLIIDDESSQRNMISSMLRQNRLRLHALKSSPRRLHN